MGSCESCQNLLLQVKIPNEQKWRVSKSYGDIEENRGSLRTLALVALVLGLAIINPIFAEESRERNMGIIINLMVVLFATIGLGIGLSRLDLSFGKMLPNLDPFTVILYDHLLLTMIFSLVGIFLLYIGIRKLDRIE